MTWTAAFTSGDGTPDAVRPPQRCTCTRTAVGTLAETLGCPARWREMPGGIWVHTRPPRRRRQAPRDRNDHQGEQAMTDEQQQLCQARPDDCPNGPEPHAYYNPQGPVETWTHCACCRQPGEPETPPGELLEELF